MTSESMPISDGPGLAGSTAEIPRTKGGLRRFPGAIFASPVGFAACFFMLIGSWAYWQSGSVGSILPYLNGQRIFVHPLEMAFGRKPPEENINLSTVVTNRSARTLTLLGAQRQCSCVSTDVFPIVIKPGASRQITFSAHLPGKEGPFEQRIALFTDHAEAPQFEVRVLGAVAC